MDINIHLCQFHIIQALIRWGKSKLKKVERPLLIIAWMKMLSKSFWSCLDKHKDAEIKEYGSPNFLEPLIQALMVLPKNTSAMPMS